MLVVWLKETDFNTKVTEIVVAYLKKQTMLQK